jgi:hypothetical protein
MSSASSGPILIHRQRLVKLQQAVSLLLQDVASVEFEGTAYGSAQLPTLYALSERLQVKAAIEAIEAGNQSYAINGMTYTRGDLRTLYDRDRQLEAKAGRAARGGIGIRFGVPVQ